MNFQLNLNGLNKIVYMLLFVGNLFTLYWLAYADDVNILGGSIHTLKKNAETLVAATKEIGLEVSADKTKYMVKS